MQQERKSEKERKKERRGGRSYHFAFSLSLFPAPCLLLSRSRSLMSPSEEIAKHKLAD